MFDYDISEFIKYASESVGFLPDIIKVAVEATEEEEEDEEEQTGKENNVSDKTTIRR